MSKEPKSKLTVDEELIRKLAALLEETNLNEIELQEGDSKVRVGKGGVAVAAAAPAPVSAPAPATNAPAASTDSPKLEGAVTSPMVGVCYLSPDPDSPQFCNVGDTVKAGDTLLLIEAMKVFNPITAPKTGKVMAILVEDGRPVEFGEPLIVVE